MAETCLSPFLPASKTHGLAKCQLLHTTSYSLGVHSLSFNILELSRPTISITISKNCFKKWGSLENARTCLRKNSTDFLQCPFFSTNITLVKSTWIEFPYSALLQNLDFSILACAASFFRVWRFILTFTAH